MVNFFRIDKKLYDAKLQGFSVHLTELSTDFYLKKYKKLSV